jgi:hypothetical protein
MFILYRGVHFVKNYTNYEMDEVMMTVREASRMQKSEGVSMLNLYFYIVKFWRAAWAGDVRRNEGEAWGIQELRFVSDSNYDRLIA